MNYKLKRLQAYPFERLQELKKGITPKSSEKHIALSIGEPQHAPPQFVLRALTENIDKVAHYSATKGLDLLRGTIIKWLASRFDIPEKSLDPDKHVLPLCGTREGIFSFAQSFVDVEGKFSHHPYVAMPNPFYQIYEGAAFLSGAEPYYINCDPDNDHRCDFESVPAEDWKKCQLLYICTPGNPSGKVISLDELKQLITLADKHDFVIASDECYTDIYPDENAPPPSLLQACAAMGRYDYRRCVVFHSLSKRSNVPGLRSGFIAGEENLISNFLRYRTYHGCAMPLPTQLASVRAWQDEKHVQLNRQAYREKFTAVNAILQEVIPSKLPDAGFYLWLKTPIDDEAFAKGLFHNENVTVLPGSYLARSTSDGNPGKNYVRIALVASINDCVQAAQRIVRYCHSLG